MPFGVYFYYFKIPSDMTSTHSNPPKLHNDALSTLDVSSSGRNYGIVLGVLTSVYLIIINLTMGEGHEDGVGIPMGYRFAKHLLIVPVVWIAINAFAKSMPEGHAFKGGIGFMARIAIWAAATVAVLNVVIFAVTGISFEQFINEGQTFLTAFLNSGLLLFETAVFVMIIGFVVLQYIKGKGSPED